MKVQRLIEKYKELYENVFDFGAKLACQLILQDLEQLDELETGHADEAPRYLKNILARLRELPDHNREVWLKAIMGEFKEDFSHVKWREGYEQGKFEGEWVGNQLKDADKVRRELNKVKIPQFISDYIEYAKKEDYHLLGAMTEIRSHKNKEIDDWFYTDDNIENFARAWLDGYEVENRYRVKMKGIVNALSFLSYHKKADIWTVTDKNNSDGHRAHHTRKELEESGFGEVFNSPLFEVLEVE